MMIRYIPADPAGNLTAIVLSPVAAQDRAKIAAEMMARCPEGFEQVGFADETSLTGDLPTLCMMGGEFCGNATRAFACYVAKVRGRQAVQPKFLELLAARMDGHTRYNLAVANGGAPQEMEALAKRMKAAFPNYTHFWQAEIDATLSSYIGAGVLGAGIQFLD